MKRFSTAVDIKEAVKYRQFIKDPFFEGCSAELATNGNAIGWSGGFSVVFPIVKGSVKWAFKVWHWEITSKAKYDAIYTHLNKINLPYFTEFSYVEKGLLVNGQLLDACRMKWIDGDLLVHYISANLRNTANLENLANNFLEMVKQLHSHSVSHGDLQHENIFVTKTGEIKLIDYDNICVPEIEGSYDSCMGRPGFQHPSRHTSAGKIASPKVDYFSELIIYISIRAVIENPILWDKYNIEKTDSLLISHKDICNFESAPIKVDLELLSPRVTDLVKILKSYLAAHLNLYPFYDH